MNPLGQQHMQALCSSFQSSLSLFLLKLWHPVACLEVRSPSLSSIAENLCGYVVLSFDWAHTDIWWKAADAKSLRRSTLKKICVVKVSINFVLSINILLCCSLSAFFRSFFSFEAICLGGGSKESLVGYNKVGLLAFFITPWAQPFWAWALLNHTSTKFEQCWLIVK